MADAGRCKASVSHQDGRKLETVRITNSPAALRAEIAEAGEHPRVVVEATYGWYWAADVLEKAGAEVAWVVRGLAGSASVRNGKIERGPVPLQPDVNCRERDDCHAVRPGALQCPSLPPCYASRSRATTS